MHFGQMIRVKGRDVQTGDIVVWTYVHEHGGQVGDALKVRRLDAGDAIVRARDHDGSYVMSWGVDAEMTVIRTDDD